MTLSALSDELAQVRTKKKEFLAQIERIVPWKEWLALIEPCYYKGERGNKPYPLETMHFACVPSLFFCRAARGWGGVCSFIKSLQKASTETC